MAQLEKMETNICTKKMKGSEQLSCEERLGTEPGQPAEEGAQGEIYQYIPEGRV